MVHESNKEQPWPWVPPARSPISLSCAPTRWGCPRSSAPGPCTPQNCPHYSLILPLLASELSPYLSELPLRPSELPPSPPHSCPPQPTAAPIPISAHPLLSLSSASSHPSNPTQPPPTPDLPLIPPQLLTRIKTAPHICPLPSHLPLTSQIRPSELPISPHISPISSDLPLTPLTSAPLPLKSAPSPLTSAPLPSHICSHTSDLPFASLTTACTSHLPLFPSNLPLLL